MLPPHRAVLPPQQAGSITQGRLKQAPLQKEAEEGDKSAPWRRPRGRAPPACAKHATAIGSVYSTEPTCDSAWSGVVPGGSSSGLLAPDKPATVGNSRQRGCSILGFWQPNAVRWQAMDALATHTAVLC